MKERPIIFSADMVRAILEGQKTQTRRIMSVQPPCNNQNWQIATLMDTTCREDRKHRYKQHWVVMDGLNQIDCYEKYFKPKFGYVGDRLWVRENFAVQPELWERDHLAQPVHYMADICDKRTIEDYVCKPSIHMPRWASRITLEITNIRVEQLQDISEEDAKLEGAEANSYHMADGSIDEGMSISPRCNFAYWWAGKYGPESWNSNPWVWVIEFKRV